MTAAPTRPAQDLNPEQLRRLPAARAGGDLARATTKRPSGP